MPDVPSSSASMPRDWGEAFAALPLERPANDGWARVAAKLDARRNPRWPLWLAAAAALLLAVALPWQWQREHARPRERPRQRQALRRREWQRNEAHLKPIHASATRLCVARDR